MFYCYLMLALIVVEFEQLMMMIELALRLNLM
jgi:hypothetical protein